MMGVAIVVGCQTNKKKEKMGTVRIHLQANPNETNSTQVVSVVRSAPVPITISFNPVLTEANLLAARVLDTPGGFAIQLKFDESGTLMLEQYSASNPGRHFVIFGQWGESPGDFRWLAAPLITRRLSKGELTFTADITRKEADEWVLRLNNVATKIHKGMFKT